MSSNISSINYSGSDLPPSATPLPNNREVAEIRRLCREKIKVTHMKGPNGPKNWDYYLRHKTLQLVKEFEKRGGRDDAVIRECFRSCLRDVITSTLLSNAPPVYIILDPSIRRIADNGSSRKRNFQQTVPEITDKDWEGLRTIIKEL